MSKALVLSFIISFTTAIHGIAQQTSELFNVLSIPNGTYIVKAPSTYKTVPETSNDIVAWTKEAIIDGTTTVGWSSSEKAAFPFEFVFELPEMCILQKFGFNTQCETQFKGISAKGVRVDISTTSPTENFVTAGEFKLNEYAATKYFEIAPTKARWIKVTLLSNYGFADFTELMEIEAWGKHAVEDVAKIDLTGDWESNWGLASIRQTGSNIQGCYVYRNGVFKNAGVDRRILTYEWVEEEANAAGHGVLVVNEEGTRLNGIWGFGDDLNRYGLWVFRKKSNSPSLCYTDNRSAEATKKEQDIIVERMKMEIEAKGKLIIYGINFETNSSTIKEESSSTLNEIYGLLTANPQMKLNIEGHTDNVGSNEDNKKLSSSRAESVRNYLVNKGIAAQRLTSIGKGEEHPMADNNSQLGRAANRRVELKLQ